jgi:hypothetical protein
MKWADFKGHSEAEENQDICKLTTLFDRDKSATTD